MDYPELNEDDKKLLLRAPVLVTLLAANRDGKLDDEEEEKALEQLRLKEFSTDPILQPYYQELSGKFNSMLDEIDKILPNDIHDRKVLLQAELANLPNVLNKLDKNFDLEFRKSLKSFNSQVAKAHRTLFEYFVLPLNIDGITD